MRLLIFLLLFIPGQASAAWYRATSDHFIVYSEGSSETVRSFARKLENFDAVLSATTGVNSEPAANKLIVFVVENMFAVQRQYSAKGGNVAGFYRPEITGTIAVVPRRAGTGEFELNSDKVLFHEYFHHFMLQNAPTGYPAWYVEGAAEYFSTTQFKPDGIVAFGLPAKHRLYGMATLPHFPIKRMFLPNERRLSDDETEAFYGWSWLLTHYLRYAKDRKGQLAAYLRAFGSGTDPLEAATQAFGPIEKLQKELIAYHAGRRITYSQASGLKLPDSKIDVVALSAAEGALMPIYMRSMRTSTSEAETKEAVEEARKMAARYPTEPMALDALAEFENDAKRYDEAERANNALIAARPGDARALLRAARIATARVEANKESKDTDWKPIRSMIVKANRAAPNDPFPLYAFYRWHIDSGTAIPPVAVDGLKRALELAPQVSQLRFMLATQLISDGKRDMARFVLAPLLNDPHSAEVREAARNMLNPAPDGSKSLEKMPETK